MLVGGLVIGALAAVYFLGTPRGHSLPGTRLKPPDNSAAPSGMVAVSIDEKNFRKSGTIRADRCLNIVVRG